MADLYTASASIETSQMRSPLHTEEAQRALDVTPHAPLPRQDDAQGMNLSLVDAFAIIGAGRNLVTDYIVGPNNQVAHIQVTDPTTGEVIASSPPDSISRIQQEMQAYQNLASQGHAP